MNRYDETRRDEGLSDYYSIYSIFYILFYIILISQIFSNKWVVMIQAWKFESTAYRLFCELAQFSFLPFVF